MMMSSWPVGSVGIDAERIVDVHVAHVARAELVVGARQAEGPMPLLADGLDGRRVLGHRTKSAHTNRPGVSIAATPTVVNAVRMISSFVLSGS